MLMRQRATWFIALAIVIAVAAWFVVRRGDDRGPSETAGSKPTTVARPEAAHDSAPTSGPATKPVDGGSAAPGSNIAGNGAAAAARPGETPTAPRAQGGDPGRPSLPAAPPPTLPAGSDGSAGSGGKFTDRTGWADNSVAKQLNKEFMPLASECIEQAVARNRKLQGLLAFTMVISPTDSGKAIVSSLTVRPDNQINDPELFECIRESSFSLEGLKAPHDFDITMPIEPEGSGQK